MGKVNDYKNKSGTLNQDDLDHNQRCQDLYELQDNKLKKGIKSKKVSIKRKSKRSKKNKRTKVSNRSKKNKRTKVSNRSNRSKKNKRKYLKGGSSESQIDNMEILRYINSLGITLPEYNLLKQISSVNGGPIRKWMKFFDQYRSKGLTLHEIVEAYQLGGILEICEDKCECRELIDSKKESIMLMREMMKQEFCKAKNDTGCVGITSPEFLKFLHYFRPPPDSGDYPDNELLDYVRLWNDCNCGSQIDYSSPSVWRNKISL